MEQVNIQRLKAQNISNKSGCVENIFIFTTITGRQYKEHPKQSLTLQGLNIDGTKRNPVRIELVSEILGHSYITITKQVYAMFDKQSVLEGFLLEDDK